jgi:hypothetical protein
MLFYLIDIVFPCSNIWSRAKVFLCLWPVRKAWAENVVKNIRFAEERAKVLCALGRIMYLKGCPIDSNLVLWVEQQIDLLQTSFPNVVCFVQYLKEHWFLKTRMCCVGN